MSFNSALSGLQAASVDLSVTSNNIANVATTGFKYSRSEFGDIYAVSPFGNTATAVGNGVQIDNVSQQFTQGNFEFTDASLDLAISGQGFFVVSQNQAGTDRSYTRAGEFRVNADGYIVNNEGKFLQAFPVDPTTGAVTSSSLNTTSSINLPPSTGAPQATTEIEVGVNLNASASGLDPANFDPSASNTYTNSTSTTIFDSLGESHVLTYYYVKDVPGSATNAANDPNQWQMFTYLDGAPINVTGGAAITHPDPTGSPTVVQNAAQFNFFPDGSLNSTTPAPIVNTAVALSNGANPLTLTHDYANNTTTQFAANFSVNTLNPTGFSTGRLTGLDISEEGLVRATYTNGISTPMGKISLADFPNSQGLVNIGGSSWKETTDSGAVVSGEAGTGRFGLIQSGALESSNVDLTQQLVNLITAQRNFQANARSIETSNTLTQTIIQIR
ncbi:MAG: flagellar hook protein FlgE [Gammaproteobacteria bacterium]|nr:flagellar hook protein FlgE [Gammaproteobacteria bacterium]